jgi:uncharacterized surface protein with fasciclin (FAS1) repeats
MTIFMTTAIAQTRLPTDIVDTAVGAGNFETLVTAVTAANLVETLKSPGPFTVFAPSDSAFAKLPAGTIEALLNNIPLLTKILTYHVIAGEYSADELLSRGSIQTVQGQSVRVKEKYVGKVSYVYVNNSRVEGSVLVKNGIIHIISSVLMPL